MGKDNRYIVRRTISQERFEVLWDKRRNGQATLRDLTEMDEIINRDPSVRQFVLHEMENDSTTTDNTGQQDMLQQPVRLPQSFTGKLKKLFNKIFNSFIVRVIPIANC